MIAEVIAEVIAEAIAYRGSVTVNSDQTLTYLPELNHYGSTSVAYRISNGVGGNGS